MSTALLLLEGPLQSWGTQGRFGLRDTETVPTKSGVIGLVACAMGIRRGDDNALLRLRTLKMAVRVDRSGTLLRDYHTSGGGTFRGRDHSVYGSKYTALSQRYYLQDASFVVGLEGDETLTLEVEQAVCNPRWPLFLGRRSCVPSRKVFLARVEADCETAVRHAIVPYVAGRKQDCPERHFVETDSFTGQPRMDVPVSFVTNHRRYDQRFVASKELSTSDEQAGETP